MPRNGSGTYTLPENPFQPNTVISSSAVNNDFSDVADALTGSVASNGVTTITQPLKNPVGDEAAPGISFGAFPDSGLTMFGNDVIALGADGTSLLVLDIGRRGVGEDGNTFFINEAIPCPVGRISSFAGDTAPAGWLFIYGQNILRASFPELFTVIGTLYGSGDGSTTYGLPDGRGRVDAGKDDMGGSAAGRLTSDTMSPDGVTLGATGGEELHVLQDYELAAHDHDGVTGGESQTHFHGSDGVGAFIHNSGGGEAAGTSGNGWSNRSNTGPNQTDHDHTIPSDGDDVGHNTVQPTIIFNKMIYVGRAT